MDDQIAIFFWSIKNSYFYYLFEIITGKLYIAISSLIFIIYAIGKLKKSSLQFLIILFLSITTSDIICYRLLKPTFSRERPRDQLNISQRLNPLKGKDYSMPSNHSANIFAFFTVYLILVKSYWGIVLINSLLISFSRIVLVKHYLSDVLAGIVVGMLIGFFFIYLLSLYKKRKYPIPYQ